MILLVRGADGRYVELSWDAWIHALERHPPETQAQTMIVRIGDHEFDDVLFDAERDVLYMHKGKPVPAQKTIPTLEGHAVMFDESGEIIGITVVNAKWLAERDGRITVSIPESACGAGRLETSARDLAPALVA